MDKIKVIQYGVCHEHASGKIATLRHLPEVFEVAAVVDDRASEAAKLAGGNLEPYAGYPLVSEEEAFRIPGIQAAFVEVPNNDLVAVGGKCAERGWALHLDKPAGETLEPYAELLDYCKAHRIPLQMGYMYRGNPAFQFCIKAVREGLIGDVFEMQMSMSHNYGGPEYQQYIAEFRGGIMFNLGCHLIDFVVSVMGRPEGVTSFLRSAPGDADSCKNNTVAVLEYPHGFAVLRACSKEVGNVDTRRLKICGTAGTIEMCPVEVFDGRPQKLQLRLAEARGGYQAGVQEIDFGVRRDRYREQLLEFAAIVRGERENPYTYEHDRLVHEITLAAGGYTRW